MCREYPVHGKEPVFDSSNRKSLYVQGLGEQRPFFCSLGDDQLQELVSVSIGRRPILTFLKGVGDQTNGYPLWVWEVHMHSLKGRWDPANLFRSTANWQWDQILPEESQREQKAWPGVLAWRVSSSFHVWSVWAKTGQDRPGPSQFTSWFSARDYNSFQGKILHLFLVFLMCMCACLLLVLRVCVHQKELADAFSFAPFVCLTLWPCVALKPLPQDLFSLPPVWWFPLEDPMGMFISTAWNVSLLPGKSSFGPSEFGGRRMHKDQGACLKPPPIITFHKDWGEG